MIENVAHVLSAVPRRSTLREAVDRGVLTLVGQLIL